MAEVDWPAMNVLFVSRANLARSLLAEACLNHLGHGRFRAYSCGVPGQAGHAVPTAVLDVLQAASISPKGLRSKSWAEFIRMDAPRMNFVIALDADTVRDHPSWPGQPDTALWATPPVDPGGAGAAQTRKDALSVLYSLRRRLELLVALPLQSGDRAALRSDVRDMAYMK